MSTSLTVVTMSLVSDCREDVKPWRLLRQDFVITRALRNSVVAIDNCSVRASVRESELQSVDPSQQIVSKQWCTDSKRLQKMLSESICCTHRVRQRSFNLCTDDSGCVVAIAVSSALCLLGCASKKRYTLPITSIMLHTAEIRKELTTARLSA